MHPRLALLATLPLLLTLLLPAPCLAADSIAEPAPNSAPVPAIDPDMDEGHRQFAHANYEKALEHYLKALGRDEEDAYLHFRIGLTYYMSGDLENSHTHWLKSYDIDNDLPDKFVSKIKSKSMLPTLFPGDIIITDNQHHIYAELKYNDIIDFNIEAHGNATFARRIIGLPGDTIDMNDNIIIRNDESLNEDYLYINKIDDKKTNNGITRINIPRDKYFVLGDNRNVSFDSRHFGVIDKRNIFGKILGVMKRSSNESPGHENSDLN